MAERIHRCKTAYEGQGVSRKTRVAMKGSFRSCVSLFLLLVAAFVDATIVEDGLPVSNLSRYTFRYLSEDGNDTESCLSSQTYPPGQDNSTMSEYCGSLIYALSGSYNYSSRDVEYLVVIILPGRYSMGTRGIKIIRYKNIYLTKMPGATGEVIIRCDTFLDDKFNNLYVITGVNISLTNIVFTDCGSSGSPVRLQETLNAVVSNCTFRFNRNCGLTLDRSKHILIVNSTFHDNNSTALYKATQRLDLNDLRFGGGLLISLRPNYVRDNTNTIVVQNCMFIKNHANINELNINDTRPPFYRPRGHGGAIVVAFEHVSNYTVTIVDTKIIENTASTSGGGVFVSFSNTTTDNQVIFKNTSFKKNVCEKDGGAISMNTFQVANNNTVIVEDSRFDGNRAQLGGGACSVNLQDALVPVGAKAITNVAVFRNSNFTNNTSPSGGSAVNLVSSSLVNQVVTTTNFTDCNFIGNKDKSLRRSAIMSFRFPISLSGTNVFESNEGGGISLMQSRVDVNGTVLFLNNTAVAGGGLALEDDSLIQLLRGSNLSFIGNSATMQGGAIHVLAPSVAIDFYIAPIFNTGCFIQYEVTKEPFSLEPSDWMASVVFENNTAGVDGAAIFATRIDRCSYFPSYNTTNSNKTNSIFDVSPPFIFSNNRVTSPVSQRVFESLATAPSNLSVSLDEPKTLANQVPLGAPGEEFVFNVTAFDQVGNPQAAIWNLNEVNGNVTETEREEFLSIPVSGGAHSYPIEGVDQSVCNDCLNETRRLTFSLVQAITGGVNDVTMMDFNILCCHPGYKFNEETSVCEIDAANNSVIVRAHLRGRYFYAKSELYVESRNGTLVSAQIPPTFQNCTRGGVRPGCLVKYDFPSEQCADGRKGFLCGECPDGEGVDLTLRQCKKCTITDAVLLTLFYIAFFAVSLLILFFNVPIPNELKGFLFFIQVIGYVYEGADHIDWDFHLSRFFGFSVHLSICPYPGYSALKTAGYGAIISLISVLAILIYIISARFSKVLSNRSSFDGIWFLSIITYKYTSDTCFDLLRCQKVSGDDSRKFVYYYNGSITCFETFHLGASIVALFAAMLVFIFPVIILVISFRSFKFTQPFTDVLTKKIKVSCRWWSGFDLLRRLLFTIVVLFFNYVHPDGTQIALFFTGLFVYIIFALFKPYKTRAANIVEALILTDLLLLTAVFLNTNNRVRKSVHPLSQLLLLLPFISFIVYITIIATSFIWKKVAPQSRENFINKIFYTSKRLLKYQSTNNESDVEPNIETMTDLSCSLQTKVDYEVVPRIIQADYSMYREELIASNTD